MARSALAESDLWRQLDSALDESAAYYRTRWGSPLLVDKPELATKPFLSVRNKVYRLNVTDRVARDLGPPPIGEVVHPRNWYSGLGDVIRCTIIVSMMDGVRATCESIQAALADHAQCNWSFKNRLRGYYAAHLSFDWPATLVFAGPPPVDGTIRVEVQVKTHLHHVLGGLTHAVYEQQRAQPDVLGSVDWIWEPENPLFDPRMLGHVVQYLDGTIVNIKEGRRK